MCPGIDSLGTAWARNHNIKVKKFPAKWKDLTVKRCVVKENQYGQYNVLAGFNRNEKMAEYADALLAITTGSKGTDNMIEQMKKLDKTIWIYEV